MLSKFKDLILEATDDIDTGIELIRTSVKAMVICSGGVAKAIVPKIQYFQNVMGVLIFCKELNYHK